MISLTITCQNSVSQALAQKIITYAYLYLIGSMTYNGTLQYRDGVRCVRATKFLSCPFDNTISLENTIIERLVRVDDHAFTNLLCTCLCYMRHARV